MIRLEELTKVFEAPSGPVPRPAAIPRPLPPKFHGSADAVLGPARAADIEATVDGLEAGRIDDLSDLALAPAEGAAR